MFVTQQPLYSPCLSVALKSALVSGHMALLLVVQSLLLASQVVQLEDEDQEDQQGQEGVGQDVVDQEAVGHEGVGHEGQEGQLSFGQLPLAGGQLAFLVAVLAPMGMETSCHFQVEEQMISGLFVETSRQQSFEMFLANHVAYGLLVLLRFHHLGRTHLR